MLVGRKQAASEASMHKPCFGPTENSLRACKPWLLAPLNPEPWLPTPLKTEPWLPHNSVSQSASQSVSVGSYQEGGYFADQGW